MNERIPRGESEFTNTDPIEGLPMRDEKGMTVRWAIFVIVMFVLALAAIRMWDAGSMAQDERRYYERKNRDAEFCEEFSTTEAEWRRCMDVKMDGLR